MYIPRHFNEGSIEHIALLIESFPLATIVGREPDGGLCANHIPLMLGAGPQPNETDTLVGNVLQGHVPRKNTSWLDPLGPLDSLVIFQGNKVYDAPADYIERLTAALVGIEVTITAVQAKRKVSQNQSLTNRAGVVNGLFSTGRTSDKQLAEEIRRFK